jgi:hypothetical protein
VLRIAVEKVFEEVEVLEGFHHRRQDELNPVRVVAVRKVLGGQSLQDFLALWAGGGRGEPLLVLGESLVLRADVDDEHDHFVEEVLLVRPHEVDQQRLPEELLREVELGVLEGAGRV